jgi:hypothetical protein
MRLLTGRNGAIFAAQKRVDLSFLSFARTSSVPLRDTCRLQGLQKMHH